VQQSASPSAGRWGEWILYIFAALQALTDLAQAVSELLAAALIEYGMFGESFLSFYDGEDPGHPIEVFLAVQIDGEIIAAEGL
jgi:hypothetical protein